MIRTGLILLTACFALLLWQGLPPRFTQAAAQAQPAEPTTILLRLGEKAAKMERWDGKVTVSGGTIAGLSSRHFSAGDEITGTSGWKARTREDAVALWSDIHYTEMRPGSVPPVYHLPVGVYLRVDGPSSARVAVETSQGNFDFELARASEQGLPLLDGRVIAQRVPSVEAVAASETEDDEPSMAFLPDGAAAVAWVAYRDKADRVMVRMRRNGTWSAAEAITEPGDHFKTSTVATPDGALWVIWSQRDGTLWSLRGRMWRNGSWSAAEQISAAGSATFHRAAAGPDGSVHAVWQEFHNGQSDIMLRTWKGRWGGVVKVSESPANDWEPAVAGSANGVAHVAWDGYDKGNYDIFYRKITDGRAGPVEAVTKSPRFQAHASISADGEGMPWIAWDESGVNWGKDQGFLIPVPLAAPLHQQRSIAIVRRSNAGWETPAPSLQQSLPQSMKFNSEHPQIIIEQGGRAVVVFRHWTRRLSRTIGSVLAWENYVTTFQVTNWSTPQPVDHSPSWIEKLPWLARSPDGDIHAAWMTDNRPFATNIPANADIYMARVSRPGPMVRMLPRFEPYKEVMDEAIPIHSNNDADVGAIRAYRVNSSGKQFRIMRGDMHRHTDFSQDFKYDGSLFELYRYALDAASFDYIAPTDHQTGYDQEFSWWQHEKYVDLFVVANTFTPIFAYERSLVYPNGHRNIIRPMRGIRPFPIPADEAKGLVGAKKLYDHLRATNAISMPHSSATDQGTDWRDNDPEVEPLVELFQGYRNSYEYEGAPRAATALNVHAQKSGWQPQGFYWNALAKGYKLGVQASSDHWSTHISYACLLTEGLSREQMMDAIRKRHSYAATDNIVLDFRARAGSAEHIMGDVFDATGPLKLAVRVKGTNPIKQIDLISDAKFIYTTRPRTAEASFEFAPPPGKGESWFYVRVLQEDGQLAWSSPIWVKR
ncbi:MAG: hypothetical protein ABI972_18685 [Acidobacteriota bacterium]